MHDRNLENWQHLHGFGQDRRRPGEARTFVVVGLTLAMMVVEVVTGILFGSMALLADGLHMASHAAALGINALAYVYSRRHAHDARYNFGTGKVNALGGFTGAVLLVVFAVVMAWESVDRMIHPVAIAFDQAILVAVVGLIVNGASVFILDHGPSERRHDHDGGNGDRDREEHGHGHHHDHNLRSAYLHVLADALTSLLAIFALLAAKYLGLIWMDPTMGVLGAVLVSWWSLALLRTSSGVLLDRRGPDALQAKIRARIESDGDNRVADLHLWSIGPSVYGVILTVVSHDPKPPGHYKQLLPSDSSLAHVTVEVHQCSDGPGTELGQRAAMGAGR